MTSKEKAEELFKTFRSYLGANLMFSEDADEDAKQCALIAVNEIMIHCYQVMKPFWEEVKQEIEKI